MDKTNCTAVILAAGCGSRIAELTTLPKPFLKIAERPLWDWHFAAWGQAGIRDVVVVIGYEGQQVRDYLVKFSRDFNIRFVENQDYKVYGNGYSLYLGIAAAAQDVMIFDGDLIYAADILPAVVKSPASAIVTAPGALTDFECAKALVDGQGMVRLLIDKRAVTDQELAQHRFVGEAVGILFLRAQEKRALLQECERFFAKRENLRLNWEHLMSSFLTDHDVATLSIPADQCMEIDNREDYERAVAVFSEKKRAEGV